jgi:hypothetical protein
LPIRSLCREHTRNSRPPSGNGRRLDHPLRRRRRHRNYPRRGRSRNPRPSDVARSNHRICGRCPGRGFDCHPYFRISVAMSEDTVQEGLQRAVEVCDRTPVVPPAVSMNPASLFESSAIHPVPAAKITPQVDPGLSLGSSHLAPWASTPSHNSVSDSPAGKIAPALDQGERFSDHRDLIWTKGGH